MLGSEAYALKNESHTAPPSVPIPEEIRRYLDLDDNTIDYFEMFYSNIIPIQNRVAFPVRDEYGTVCNYAGISPTAPSLRVDYLFPFHPILYLFNMHRFFQHNPQELILVRGILPVIRLYQWGYTNVVSFISEDLTLFQRKLLGKCTSRVLLPKLGFPDDSVYLEYLKEQLREDVHTEIITLHPFQ